MSNRQYWVWYGGQSHRIRGYGQGLHTTLEDHWEDMGHVSKPPPYTFVSCITYCDIRVQVHVPDDSVVADAAMPKMRPTCQECVAAA